MERELERTRVRSREQVAALREEERGARDLLDTLAAELDAAAGELHRRAGGTEDGIFLRHHFSASAAGPVSSYPRERESESGVMNTPILKVRGAMAGAERAREAFEAAAAAGGGVKYYQSQQGGAVESALARQVAMAAAEGLKREVAMWEERRRVAAEETQAAEEEVQGLWREEHTMREQLARVGKQVLQQQERLAGAREEELARVGERRLLGGGGLLGAEAAAAVAEAEAEQRRVLEQRHVQLRTELRSLERQVSQAGKRLQALATEEWQLAQEAGKRKEEADGCKRELVAMEGVVTEVQDKWEEARRVLNADIAMLYDAKVQAEHDLWELRMESAESLDDLERRLHVATATTSAILPQAQRTPTQRRKEKVTSRRKEAVGRPLATGREGGAESVQCPLFALAGVKDRLDGTLQGARDELQEVQANLAQGRRACEDQYAKTRRMKQEEAEGKRMRKELAKAKERDQAVVEGLSAQVEAMEAAVAAWTGKRQEQEAAAVAAVTEMVGLQHEREQEQQTLASVRAMVAAAEVERVRSQEERRAHEAAAEVAKEGMWHAEATAMAQAETLRHTLAELLEVKAAVAQSQRKREEEEERRDMLAASARALETMHVDNEAACKRTKAELEDATYLLEAAQAARCVEQEASAAAATAREESSIRLAANEATLARTLEEIAGAGGQLERITANLAERTEALAKQTAELAEARAAAEERQWAAAEAAEAERSHAAVAEEYANEVRAAEARLAECVRGVQELEHVELRLQEEVERLKVELEGMQQARGAIAAEAAALQAECEQQRPQVCFFTLSICSEGDTQLSIGYFRTILGQGCPTVPHFIYLYCSYPEGYQPVSVCNSP
jgi:hypothetical protein